MKPVSSAVGDNDSTHLTRIKLTCQMLRTLPKTQEMPNTSAVLGIIYSSSIFYSELGSGRMVLNNSSWGPSIHSLFNGAMKEANMVGIRNTRMGFVFSPILLSQYMFFSERLGKNLRKKHFNYPYHHSEIATVNIFMVIYPDISLWKFINVYFRNIGPHYVFYNSL